MTICGSFGTASCGCAAARISSSEITRCGISTGISAANAGRLIDAKSAAAVARDNIRLIFIWIPFLSYGGVLKSQLCGLSLPHAQPRRLDSLILEISCFKSMRWPIGLQQILLFFQNSIQMKRANMQNKKGLRKLHSILRSPHPRSTAMCFIYESFADIDLQSLSFRHPA